jgi:hypothetical protein
MFAGVSFVKTPLAEIGELAERIAARGWQETGERGDPWAAEFRKDFPETESAGADAELAEIMGDYWMSADEMRALRSREGG